MKYLADVTKGLSTLHNCNLIHGSVKPGSIFIQDDNSAMLGELGKMELDTARHTHQLFSKVLIAEAIPQTLMYWSPEILTGGRYTTASDIWALGVTFYQVITGEHPFNVRDEQSFKDDVISGNVDWSRLVGYERLKNIL
jgi:eukaryotic-like serine/threonine-protein kinase